MSKVDRAMMIVRNMNDEERAELFDAVDADYCTSCGGELPEEGKPPHDCPYDEGGDGEDDGEEEEPSP